MPRLPDSREMAQWDKAAVDFGIPEFLLMENAGRVCCEAAMQRFGRPVNAVVFMGGGNNGGDAACMARHLNDAWAGVSVWHTKELDKLKEAAGRHADLAMKDGINFIKLDSDADIAPQTLLRGILGATGAMPDLIVDGLLGTGLESDLKISMQKLIDAINKLAQLAGCPVISIDIPSGLNSSTGAPCPVAIRASVTVTLAAAKPGLLLPCSRPWVGDLECRKIGIPRAVNSKCPASMRLLEGDSLMLLPPLPESGFKNTYGHVVIIGGWRGYAGAAHLAALAALRSGAGLVTACAPEESLALIKNGLPEVMVYPAMAGAGWPHELSLQLIELIQRCTAIVVGPGMGRRDEAGAFLGALLRVPQRPPAVIDADALALLARNQELHAFISAKDILTPHPGEAGLMLGSAGAEIQGDRQGALSRLCGMFPAVIVLKGAGTLVGQAGRDTLLCPYDIPQLSIGGSGDVLAGCIGALIGSRQYGDLDSLSLAGAGVAMHAMAGIICDEIYPDRGNQASQLADALPRVRGFVLSQQKKKPAGVLPWPV